MIPELVALLVCAAVGAALARRAGEALLVGIGVGAGVLLLLSVVHVPWSRSAFAIAMAAIATIAMFTWRGESREARAESPWLPAVPFLLFAAVLVVGYATFATLAPVWEFDFISDWGFKARADFAARGIDWAALQLQHDIHADYPPLLTLAFDILAIARGAWNDQAMGWISVAFGVALLVIIHREALEESGSRLTAAFIVAAMVPLACSPWIGLAEGPLVAYGTTALLLIRRGNAMAGAVMLGLAASTKNEGLTLIVAAAAALVVAKRAREIVRLWPAVVIPLPWLILRRVHHLQTDITEGNVLSRIVAHLSNPRPLLEAFVTYNVGQPWFWIALALGIVLAIRALLEKERFVLVAVAVQFLFYVGAYLATPHDVDWHVRWSWERLTSHLAPALTYVVLIHLVNRGAATSYVAACDEAS